MTSSMEVNDIPKSTLYTAIWVEYGICTVVMILRAYSQFFVLRKFAADDFVMLGAYLCQGVASALCTASVYYGLGSSVMNLGHDDTVHLLKYTMISLPFGVVASLLGRISFILFLLSSVITAHNPHRKVLWVLIGLQVIINIIPCVLQFTQCKPVSALWDPVNLISKCQNAVVVQQLGYFQGAFNAMTDLILTIIGLAVILSLKTHRSNKIILCSILSLSLLAMVAAILRTVQIRSLDTPEFTHAMGLWAIWYLTEGTVVIVTASVPRLRAIVVLGRQRSRSSSNAYLTPIPTNTNAKTSGPSTSNKRRSPRTTYLDTSASVNNSLFFTERGRSENASLDAAPMESATELVYTVPPRSRERES
ncbi:hypothetical protein BJX76DRAFT_348388 [Aspergillus varians]